MSTSTQEGVSKQYDVQYPFCVLPWKALPCFLRVKYTANLFRLEIANYIYLIVIYNKAT